jgi:L-alanine-DL-glutamate epimerase-like enolase superfamily enzyme
MKITDVKVHLLAKKCATTVAASRGSTDYRFHAIVEVETDEGISGLGEGIGQATLVKTIVETKLRDEAIGLDPFDTAAVYEKLARGTLYWEHKGSVVCAASGIETACWDIMGKALNVPVYKLLGGRVHDKVRAYASDLFWEEDPASMAKTAASYVEQGFDIVKTHLGVLSPTEEEVRVKAMREAVGPDVGLMIDINCGYDLGDAMEAIKRWGEYNPFWIEEPLIPMDLEGLVSLRPATDVPFSCGENEFGVHGFKQLLDTRAVAYVMPDIGRVGGLLESKKIAALAEAYGVVVSPHNFSSGVLLAATLHLMASTPNAKLLELDPTGDSVYEELLVDPIKRDGAWVGIPEAPGLGVELRDEVREKYELKPDEGIPGAKGVFT